MARVVCGEAVAIVLMPTVWVRLDGAFISTHGCAQRVDGTGLEEV